MNIANGVTAAFGYRNDVVVFKSLVAVTLNALAFVSAPDRYTNVLWYGFALVLGLFGGVRIVQAFESLDVFPLLICLLNKKKLLMCFWQL